MEFDLLRNKAEPKMQMGGGFPESCALVLRSQDATLSGQEKSLELANAQGGLGFSDVAKQMRRVFGSRSRAARQDVLVAADVDASSVSDKDLQAWVVCGLAEMQGDL